ncbi:hypothetical protein BDR06DRAFT_1020957 [Suillus hirtellus]|nr:hypothetical protein BDR06DRAFT_1020957 [Suillus hirtellus]
MEVDCDEYEGEGMHLELMDIFDEGDVNIAGNDAQPELVYMIINDDEDVMEVCDTATWDSIQPELVYVIINDDKDTMEVCNTATWDSVQPESMVVDQVNGDVEMCDHSDDMDIEI